MLKMDLFDQLTYYNTLLMLNQAIQSFKKYGYGILPNFMSANECTKAINQINRLIEYFQPTESSTVQFTTKNQNNRSHDYFLNSSDKVHFFFEEKAFQNGKLTVPKLHSINKIGHALHEKNKIFENITYQKDIGQICRQCNLPNPVVVQSMAILKPPLIGGQVNIHQDSTFLYDQPETLVGFWIPLQDATVDNGCLWGLPGSHQGKLYKRSKMNWDKKQSEIHQLYEQDYDVSKFVPLQMKKGSLAFFSGRFLHKSDPNNSSKSRYAYTWHLKDANSQWSKDNWLQREAFPNFQFDYELEK